MEETTLLFRHLPSALSPEERKDLLHYLGATQVKIMGKTGPMKNTGFAVFASKEQATKVLNQLHQVEFLGSKLVVEFAKQKQPNLPSVVDSEGVRCKTEEDDPSIASDTKQPPPEPKEIKFDTTFNVWGLKHPRRPDLRYLYPPPTPSILRNIMNTLAAVPKFYVQVLHLMNKMDLPAPFGAVTITPPLHPDVLEYQISDDVDQREMDISSESESEIESDADSMQRVKVDNSAKRPHRLNKKRPSKRPKLSDLQDSGLPVVSTTPVQVSDVFEQSTGAGTKKIELKIPSTILPPVTTLPQADPVHNSGVPPTDSTQVNNDLNTNLLVSQRLTSGILLDTGEKVEDTKQYHSDTAFPPVHPSTDMADTPEDSGSYDVPLPPNYSTDQAPPTAPVVVGGFGIIQPVQKPVDKDDTQESAEREWTKSKFISSSELRKSRLSHSEMKELSVFKRYNEGEPSCRLYIKNLAKTVDEEDLHWVYGRYVDWDNDIEKNIFDIRLMKEGRMKGQAFVTLPSEKVSVTALKDTNGFILKDKPIVVQFARSAKAHEEDTGKH
ncbi:RNA-binding region-containing protein 3-like [Physella acuta]|uniref:RNA-binding region-containing protein 3-like n=1 Tax=Physella acuta TaxID=109671 RepID=UPI0027DDEC64|nr:RNA-binding region-containing protein 3-like [Physella acuta]